MMNCTIDVLKFSYTCYSKTADSRRVGAGARNAGAAVHDMIVTNRLCHAPGGLAKCIALGVDGVKAYTTVA